MALDIMLLEKSIRTKSHIPLVRFYEWEGTWLSIGYHQKDFPERWKDLLKEQKIKLVRRPSGGGGVLHHGGLTYALIWPSPPKSRREAYFKACEWLIKGFSKEGLELQFGNKSSLPGGANCFGTSSASDLIDQFGQKRIGSAQYWRFGQLLQHGEILIDPPKNLWKEVFNQSPPKPAPSWIPRHGLDQLLKESFLSSWGGIEWTPNNLMPQEWDEVKVKGKAYEFDLPIDQAQGFTAPADTISSTTLGRAKPKG